MSSNFLDKHFGRLGNRMFQSAFLYAYAKDHGIDYYFQDPKWFDKYKDDIIKLYYPDRVPDKRISIHVRRGKNPSNPAEPAYSDNPFYTHLGLKYYEEAMKLFPNERFLVFSDDIEWCKKYFIGCDFSEGHSQEQDLKWMADCKGHIIANSSFSWWAAYLGGGKTVYPKQWYADGVQRTICPKDWICI